METITLTPLQAKFIKKLYDAVMSDDELRHFLSWQRTGKTTALKEFDRMLNSQISKIANESVSKQINPFLP